MKAILYTTYGPPDLLQLAEVETPAPTAHQVLVKIHAASVNALDWRRFTMSPLLGRLSGGGFRRPKDTSLGADVAGTVEAVGTDVSRFHPGDAVFGVCAGSFAEYACAAENRLALKPANVSFEAAAAVPVAGFTAVQGLRDEGRVQPGQTVLIDGAGGGVGTFCVQIAKYLGAEVTAVCSTANLDVMRRIGADHIMDYTRQDFTKVGQRYDLIMAVNGYHSILAYRRALKPGGAWIVLGGSLAQIIQGLALGPLLSKVGSQKMRFWLAHSNQEDLLYLSRLLETGKIAPAIDRTYTLTQTPEAMTYVVAGHTLGKVVIVVSQNSS